MHLQHFAALVVGKLTSAVPIFLEKRFLPGAPPSTKDLFSRQILIATENVGKSAGDLEPSGNTPQNVATFTIPFLGPVEARMWGRHQGGTIGRVCDGFLGGFRYGNVGGSEKRGHRLAERFFVSRRNYVHLPLRRGTVFDPN